MSILLNLLILEDEPLDAELAVAALETAGYICQWDRVETRETFLERLEHPVYDLILADYRLPAFDGLAALRLFKERNIEIPFIIVSGALGEELAIESLKAGATDYVLKQRIERLGPIAERALREKEEHRRRDAAENELYKLSQAMMQSPVSVIITDTEGIVEYVNPKFTDVTGYTAADIIGKNQRILQGGRTSPFEYRQLWKTIKSGKEWRGELYNKKKDGKLYWESVSISVIKDSNDIITHYLSIKEDITERKQREKERVRQERLAAVGQLAAGVAHDFNNIMGVITLYSGLLSRSSNLSETEKEYLEIMSRQARHAAALTRQILDFSRRSVREPRPLELRLLLGEMLKFIERTIPENTQIHFSFSPGDYMVSADPTQLQQVITNLAVNARDAMPQGGKLSFHLSHLTVLADEIPPILQMRPGEWIQLTVADTGTGMDASIATHVFEPFFTTKKIGEGAGLGLAQVYGIVQQHDGYITVDSELGKGTIFTIYLPVSMEITAVSITDPIINLPHGQGETILLVEDNQVLLEAIRSILVSLNYTVITVADGLEAIAAYRRKPDAIALILSDVVMPNMDGFELVEALQAYAPPKIVLMSGFEHNEEMALEVAPFVFGWLSKPVHINALATILHEALQ